MGCACSPGVSAAGWGRGAGLGRPRFGPACEAGRRGSPVCPCVSSPESQGPCRLSQRRGAVTAGRGGGSIAVLSSLPERVQRLADVGCWAFKEDLGNERKEKFRCSLCI